DRHDEVDLVLRGQALHRLDGFAGLAAIVVFDQFDLLLAALQLETALRIDLVLPELEIREVGDRGAARHHAGSRSDHADLDGAVLRPRGANRPWSGKRARATQFE